MIGAIFRLKQIPLNEQFLKIELISLTSRFEAQAGLAGLIGLI